MTKHTRQKAATKNGKLEPRLQPHQPPICPECGSNRTWKDGLRYLTKTRTVQRYLCRSCGYRFSNPKVKVNVFRQIGEMSDPGLDLLNGGVVGVNFSIKKLRNDLALSTGKDVGSHKVTTVGKALNSLGSYNRNRRVCNERNGSRKERGSPAQMKHIGGGRAGVLQTTRMKNLAEVETRQKRAAGATKLSKEDVKGKLVDFLWHLQKQGYKTSTAKRKAKSLKWLVGLGADIFNPENVKEAIAKKRTWSDSTKVIVCDDYTTFLDMLGLTWQKPRYKRAEKLPFIPLESEIDALINACGRKVGAFLQGLKDTGADPGELAGVEWTDINLQNKTVTINHPVKGHNPRILPISNEFLQRISTFKKNGARIFNYQSIATNYYRQRKNVARKLNNPRIKKISLTTFRHWKGTMEYHKTKDIIHVKQLLGHKSIQNTMVYINLEVALFDETCDDFTVRIAKTPEEIKQLLEVGFEYVCNKNGLMFFRKRK